MGKTVVISNQKGGCGKSVTAANLGVGLARQGKLIERGIPEHEIAFIHDADTDTRKKELFAKVRQGKVRVLFGSTFKMGAGTNVRATRF